MPAAIETKHARTKHYAIRWDTGNKHGMSGFVKNAPGSKNGTYENLTELKKGLFLLGGKSLGNTYYIPQVVLDKDIKNHLTLQNTRALNADETRELKAIELPANRHSLSMITAKQSPSLPSAVRQHHTHATSTL